MMEKENKRRSGRRSPWWFCLHFDNPLRRLLHDPECLLAPYVKPGQRVCDIGCGTGFFTIALARLVGPQGKVIACDLQPQRFHTLARRARRAGIRERIVTHLAHPDRLSVEGPADFALAFWMAHEVPNQRRFFAEIYNLLTPEGRLLLCEPKCHVTKKAFGRTIEVCGEAGFVVEATPAVAISRAVLLGKGDAVA